MIIPQARPLKENHSLSPQEETVVGLAESALRRSSYPALRTVSCEFKQGALNLVGTVPNFYHKQVAQQIVKKSINGETTLNNQLEVLEAASRP